MSGFPRAAGAERLDRELFFARAVADQPVAHVFSALQAQAVVVVGAAAFVGIAFDANARLRVFGEVAGVGAQGRIIVGLDVGAVQVEVDTALGTQADGVHFDRRVGRRASGCGGGSGRGGGCNGLADWRSQFGGNRLAKQAGMYPEHAFLGDVLARRYFTLEGAGGSQCGDQ